MEGACGEESSRRGKEANVNSACVVKNACVQLPLRFPVVKQ